MTPPWLISVPVWGQRYRENFIRRSLPALLAALDYAKITNFRFLIFTDDEAQLRRYLPSVPCVGFTPPPGANAALKLANADRIALSAAAIGEAIAFINADLTISIESFLAAQRRFDQGKLLISCSTIRTLDVDTPSGLFAPNLLAWGWRYRHRWMRDSVVFKGHCAEPAIAVFENIIGDPSIVVHRFTMQPFAVYKAREISFTGPSADEFPDAFTRSEVHVVTSPSEMAIVEPAPADLPYQKSYWKLSPRRIATFAPEHATEMMYWQFSQQIVIKGKPDKWAQKIVDDILAQCDQTRPPTRLLPAHLQSRDRLRRAVTARSLLLFLAPRFVRNLFPKSLRQEFLKWI